MTRHTRPYCYQCRRACRQGLAVHQSTTAHRNRAARQSRNSATLPSGRKVATAAAYRALRDWDRQYDDVDPGNSPEFDREYNR